MERYDSGNVTIVAEFISGSQWWNDTTSSPLERNLDRYSFDLTVTTDFGTYFLDEVVHVSGQLTFQTNGTPLVGWPIRIYWDWNNGSPLVFHDGPSTDGTGNYDFYYNLTAGFDNPATVTIWAAFTNSNPIWNDANSSTTDIILQKYGSIVVIVPTPNLQYLNFSSQFH
ncbi:MAG: hypothetical protein ACW99J_17260 [Candidatus Thorarchaeota archaeon]